jgi:hypothetical protein
VDEKGLFLFRRPNKASKNSAAANSGRNR